MLILDFHALYMSEIEFWVNSGFTQLDQIGWHNLYHIDCTVLPLKIQSNIFPFLRIFLNVVIVVDF